MFSFFRILFKVPFMMKAHVYVHRDFKETLVELGEMKSVRTITKWKTYCVTIAMTNNLVLVIFIFTKNGPRDSPHG